MRKIGRGRGLGWMNRLVSLLAVALAAISTNMATAADKPSWIRSAGSGLWSAAATWENGKIPAAGARVHIQSNHVVTYDVQSDHALRAVYVAGTLSFAADKSTRMDVGVLMIEAGDSPSEEGFDCTLHPVESTLKPGVNFYR